MTVETNQVEEDCSRFKITGAVTRAPFKAASGKFARVDIECNVSGRTRKMRVRAFGPMVAELSALGQGEVVTIVGDIETQALTSKSKEPVMVDGYKVYVHELTATQIKRYGEERAVSEPKPKAVIPPPEDDSQIPF